MKIHTRHFITVLFLCCLLTACLPGAKKAEKVISDAQQATQQVAADQVATSMSSAAETLMAGSTEVDTNDLRTTRCNDGSVIAFIPSKSKMAHDGAMDIPLANRMRAQLQTKFGATAVGGQELVSKCGGDATTESIAMNAPVLMLTNISAEQSATTAVDNSLVASVKMDSCGQNIPGVVVTKTYKDGHTEQENKCGSAFTDFKSDIQLSNTLMPDWKAQLTGGVGAMVSFKCVVVKGSNNCAPVTAANSGDITQCNSMGDQDTYLSNPVKSTSGAIIEGPASVSCNLPGSANQGWTGQLIARVRSQQCSITRNGQTLTPATVTDVTYVAAKCSKTDIENIVTQCPAGSGTGTFFAKYNTLDMLEPILYVPQPSVNGVVAKQAVIAQAPYTPDQTALANIIRATGSQNVYIPNVNLNGLNNAATFDNALIKDMGANAKLSAVADCNIANNQCVTSGATTGISHVVVVLDRSSSMGSTQPTDKLTVSPTLAQGYACKAGLSNIFTTQQSSAACSAATQYLAQVPATPPANGVTPTVMDFVMHPWGSTSGPTTSAATALYTTMENALTNKAKYEPYLQFALANGWDCSGRTQSGSPNKQIFPDDMFGTCSAGSDGGAPICDGSCPGECQPTTIGTIPDDLSMQRVSAAELVLKNLARMKLNPNTKITIASFLNDQPNIQTTTYCPDGSDGTPSRQDSSGNCDMTLERQAIINLISRPASVQTYLKPVTEELTIPTDPPGTVAPSGGGSSAPSGSGWETAEQAHANGDFASSKLAGKHDYDDGQQDETNYEFQDCHRFSPPANFTDDYDCGQAAQVTSIYQGVVGVGNPNFDPAVQQYQAASNGQWIMDNSYEFWVYTEGQDQFRSSCSISNVTGQADYCTQRRLKVAATPTPPPQTSTGSSCNTAVETADQAHADGTFNNSYKLGTPVVSGVGPSPIETPQQDQVNYEFTDCHPLTPCNEATDGKFCVNKAGNEWIIRVDTPGTPPVPYNTSSSNSLNINYCSQRRLKTAPAICHACDPSQCLNLPSAIGQFAGTAFVTGNWESDTQTIAEGTHDADPYLGSGATPDGVSYEYKDCTNWTWDDDECQHDGPGSDACNTEDANMAAMTAFGQAHMVNGVIAPWETSYTQGGGTYCETRRSKKSGYEDWQDSAADLANGQQQGDFSDYEYAQCRTADCQSLEDACMDNGPASTACQDAASCWSNLLGEPVQPSTGSGSVFPAGRPWMTSQDGNNQTYCDLRKPKITAGDSALMACLDNLTCAPKVTTTDMPVCQTSQNLFNGATTTNCTTLPIPTKIDYTQSGYQGGTTVQTVTRYVPGKQDDPGAIVADTTTPIWGADYGGETPLYTTIDAVLKDPNVKADLDAKKAIGMIVLTDGVDTGDGTATTKSLCDDSKGATFLSELSAADPNASALFVSLNDFGLDNASCITKVNANNYISSWKLAGDATPKISSFIGSGSSSSVGTTLDSAKQFCLNNYGTYYEDDTVANVMSGGSVLSPPVCRSFEIQ